MRILLLGKSGMLGSAFLKHLAGNRDFEMFATDRNDLDICNADKLKVFFDRVRPDFVINCVAYTAVDACESNADVAFMVNARAVQELARLSKIYNSVLLHFSTDYVFDGEKAEGYLEEDATGPINTYGKSKLEGEGLIQQNCEMFYIIRTSWLFGCSGKNFVDTMIRLSRERERLAIVTDQVGCPTYTNDLVKAVIGHFIVPYLTDLPMIHERCFSSLKDAVGEKLAFGIYHLANAGSVSWYDFAAKIFECRNARIDLERIASEQYSLPAKRPKFSILKNSKLGFGLRPWQEALKSYLELHV